MASTTMVYKRKSNLGFSTAEWKSHGWWIKGERGSGAPSMENAKLFIGKEPIGVIPNTALEFNAGVILSISIGVSGQRHFFVTTRSVADGKTICTYTLQCENILRPIERASKVEDVIKELQQVAQWWNVVPAEEKIRRQIMSLRGSTTLPESHHGVEEQFAAARVSMQRNFPQLSNLQQPGSSSGHQYNLPVQNAEEDDGEAYKVHAVALQKEKRSKTYTGLPSDRDGRLGSNPGIPTPYAGSLREALETGDPDYVFVRKPKRQRQTSSAEPAIQKNPEVFFGSSLKPELEKGYIFGTNYTFHVEVAKVFRPSSACTNHRVLNDENAKRIYDMLRGGNRLRAQVAPMILRPKSYSGGIGERVDFIADGNSESFNRLYEAHVQICGGGEDARAEFLDRFTWEPVDGQHIRSACNDLAIKHVEMGVITEAEYNDLFSRWPAHIVIYDEPQYFIELSRQVNNDRVARCPIMTVGQCLRKIRETWIFFGRVGPSTANDSQAIIDDRARFYSTLHAATGIPPTEEHFKLSELRTKFEVHLRYACMPDDTNFQAVLRMCDDYDAGLTRYSKIENHKASSKMVITWLRPLRCLTDVSIRIFALRCSLAHGEQSLYFADFKEAAAGRQIGYAVLNACRWILNEQQPGHYAFKALMDVNVVREYNISSEEVMLMYDDAGTSFVEKWKGPICESFKEQRKYESLIPSSIRDFMRYKLEGVRPSIPKSDWILEADVSSDKRQNCRSHVQVTRSILDSSTGTVGDECLWMVDCNWAGVDGSSIPLADVPKVLEHVMKWMPKVGRWNAVFMLPPMENTSNLVEILSHVDGFEDIVIQEGTYTFSRQSSGSKKAVSYGKHKLYIRAIGGLLYVMRYPRESDWRSNAALESGAEWPTSWVEPTTPWTPSEWNIRARNPRTVMSIIQSSAPQYWMVALVGLTYMVPILVDHGIETIMVFDGKDEIRSRLFEWMAARDEGDSVPRRETRSTMQDASVSSHDTGSNEDFNKDVGGSAKQKEVASEGCFMEGHAIDDTKDNIGSTSKENIVYDGGEGACVREASEDAMRKIYVQRNSLGAHSVEAHGEPSMKDMSLTKATRNNIQEVGDEDENHAPAVVGEDAPVSFQGHIQHGILLQPQFPEMLSATDTNVNTMGSLGAMSDIHTSELGSSINTDKEWISRTSELNYEEHGDYYVDRLQHMWIHEDPSSPINPLDSDRWCTFEEKYFKRIEVQELLLRQASKPTTMAKDFVAQGIFLDSVPSISSTDNMRNDLERVLETPPE